MDRIGDLSQAFMTRRQNADLKMSLNRLTNELASGRVSDLSARVKGDLAGIGHLESNLSRLSADMQVAKETASLLNFTQQSLGRVTSESGRIARDVLEIPAPRSANNIADLSEAARQAFSTVVSALNGSLSGKSVFSGDNVTAPALADADTVLADISIAVAGSTTPADLKTEIDNWFNDPAGGFETTAYLGSPVPRSPVSLSSGDEVDASVLANNAAIKNVLAGLAFMSMASSYAGFADPAARDEVVALAADDLLTAERGMIDLQEKVGREEFKLEQISVRMTSETASLRIARTEMLEADPFETASALDQVQTQLELHYTLTARVSRLSLAQYI